MCENVGNSLKNLTLKVYYGRRQRAQCYSFLRQSPRSHTLENLIECGRPPSTVAVRRLLNAYTVEPIDIHCSHDTNNSTYVVFTYLEWGTVYAAETWTMTQTDRNRMEASGHVMSCSLDS